MDQLDALLAEALSQASRRRVKAQPDKPSKGEVRLSQLRDSFRAIYENPENWERKRGIALIHRDPQGQTTLLGNFTEYLHRKRDARKLVREAEPMLISTEEYVTGHWWLADRPQMEIDDHNSWEIRETALDLVLAELHVLASAVLIRVHLNSGWIARVELVEQTPFHCPMNSQVIYLPAGTCVLDGLSLECKLELRRQMNGSQGSGS